NQPPFPRRAGGGVFFFFFSPPPPGPPSRVLVLWEATGTPHAPSRTPAGRQDGDHEETRLPCRR
ncbi:MAG: hypothetical protein ACTHQ3_05745, partial [Motilibacteraceae bacterium]